MCMNRGKENYFLNIKFVGKVARCVLHFLWKQQLACIFYYFYKYRAVQA